MSTLTIRVTSSATNAAGTNWGEQPDLGAPSYLDMIVTGSSNPLLSDGVYDAYCLNPLLPIFLSPTSHLADGFAGNDPGSFQTVGFASLAQPQIDKINWLLAQNFTSDPKYAGEFNYGEVQVALWRLAGYTDAEIGVTPERFLNDNNRNVVSQDDIDFLVAAADAAIASGNGVVPTDAYFTTVIDPAGNVQPLIVQLQGAKLGNFVWHDSNGNGIQDDGEEGIDNVIVELYDAQGSLIATTVTGDDYSTAEVEQGYYQFTGLKPGDYQVKFIAPAGQFITEQDPNGNAQDTVDSDADPVSGLSHVVSLAAGDSDQTIDAGLYAQASLGDRVWLDANRDGIQDADEVGLANVTVKLFDCVTGDLVASTTTDANGNYLFEGLKPGDYKVEFVAPSGYVLSTQNVGADDSVDSDADATGFTGCYTLKSGEYNNTVDAGLYRPVAELGDRVWEDANGNGIQDDGELGIPGVVVNLFDCVSNELVATTTTDANGNYRFADLTPGQYKVQFVTPNGYLLSEQDLGSDDGADSDAGADGFTGCYTLAPDEINNTVDAGMYRLASLGDRVWLDANRDGIQDADEVGLANVTVKLFDCVTGDLVASTTTDANGNYLFEGLKPGQYKVEFVAPSGYVLSTQDVGSDDSVDSDADATGFTGCYTLKSGEYNNTVDAGFYRPVAEIGDRVWEDANGNGIQDNGELGIPDVVVNLFDCVSNDLVATTTTDANGNYRFADLTPGQYKVQFVTPNGYLLSEQDLGSDDGADSDAGADGFTGCYTLAPDEINNTVDAGMYRLASLGDRVWLDTNRDGIQDADEVGLANVTVKLFDCVSGDLVATTETDANGNYLFEGLKPGDYKVEFVTPAGYLLSTQDVSTDDTVDSDADAITGLTGCYTLSSGENNVTVDAGMYLPDIGIDIEKYVRGRYFEEGGENGGEGLTPGFWKTHSQYGPAPLSGWPETGYSPDDSYESIFGVDVPGTPSLLDALNARGGGVFALMRHSAAALLNASNPNVDYAYSKAEVIAMTQTAITSGNYNSTKNLFEAQNELGADLNTPSSGGVGTWVETPDYDADEPSGPFIPVGGQAIFTYVVTNTGEAALGDIQVTDDRIANLTFVGGDDNGNGLLDVDETWTYTASENVTANMQYVNIGTVSGSDAAGRVVTDSDKAHFTSTDPITHMSNSVLSSMGFSEVSNGGSSSRWADINAGDYEGNVLIVSARLGHSADYVKLEKLAVSTQDKLVTPIAIDLDGDGIQTLALDDAGGEFDLFGNGEAVASGWLGGNDAFLAVDRNGNGLIDDISELFGGNGMGDGFSKLAEFDSNGDGVIDVRDADFDNLQVWRDANGNHQTDDGELMTLAEAGVASLSLKQLGGAFMDAQGNAHLERASATLADGKVVDMTDVYFNVSSVDAAQAGVELPDLAQLLSDAASLDALLGEVAGEPQVSAAGASNADSFDSGLADGARQMADYYDQVALYA